MKCTATGTLQIYVTADFDDDGTSIGQQAYDALSKKAKEEHGISECYFTDFDFDRKIEEKN